MKKIGYIRISVLTDADDATQRKKLVEAGCDQIVVDDDRAGGTLLLQLDSLLPPEIDLLLKDKRQAAKIDESKEIKPKNSPGILQPGDWLIVTDLSRLRMAESDLIPLFTALYARRINFRALENKLEMDSSTEAPMLFQTAQILARVDATLRKERNNYALCIGWAKDQPGGRPFLLTDEQLEAARAEKDAGVSVDALAVKLGVSKPTLYRLLARKTPINSTASGA